MSAPVPGQQPPKPPTTAAMTQPQSNMKPLKPASANIDSMDPFENPNPAEEVILATGGYDHTIKFWQAHTGVCTRTIPHNDSQVNALSISPDGQLLAACGYQHIKMFDVQGSNANPVVNYEGVQKNVMSVGFQEDARWMYTGGEDGTAKIWDLRMRNLSCSRVYATGQATAIATAGSGGNTTNNSLSPVNSLRLHPNQQVLIIGDQNGNVHLWDIRQQKPENTRVVHPQTDASIQSVTVDPQGVYVAAVTNKGTCHVWDVKKVPVSRPDNQPGQSLIWLEDPRKSFTAHKRFALKCVFSPDSTMIATSSADQTAKVWRTSDLTLITELHVPNQRWVWDLAFSADSQYLFTASSDGMARLWSLPSNEVKKEFRGHQKAITSLAFRDVA